MRFFAFVWLRYSRQTNVSRHIKSVSGNRNHIQGHRHRLRVPWSQREGFWSRSEPPTLFVTASHLPFSFSYSATSIPSANHQSMSPSLIRLLVSTDVRDASALGYRTNPLCAPLGHRPSARFHAGWGAVIGADGTRGAGHGQGDGFARRSASLLGVLSQSGGPAFDRAMLFLQCAHVAPLRNEVSPDLQDGNQLGALFGFS